MSIVVKYPFIQGDDFAIPLAIVDPNNDNVAVDITNWTIKSQVRYYKRLVAELDIIIVDAALGEFTISAPKEKTVNWPAGPYDKPKLLKCNVEFSNTDGGRISSNLFLIQCREDPTRHE